MPTCFMNGLCGKSTPNKLKKSIEDPVLAPFVEVEIRAKDGAIIAQASSVAAIYGSDSVSFGVGNKSFPAAIKSLVVGSSNGMGADIEIVDQEGGDFRSIFEKISRMGTAGTDALLFLRWGWISTKCDGSTVPDNGGNTDPSQQPEGGSATEFQGYLIQNVSLDYSGGTIKYTIRCTDLFSQLTTTRVPGVIGTDSKKVHFKDAVDMVCKQLGIKAKFVAFSDASSETDFKFKVTATGTMDAMKGMLGVWKGDNRNVLECFKEWVRPHLADIGPTGKGITVYFDPPPKDSKSNGTIIFMAGIPPNGTCGDFNFDKFLVASYVVNGGGCSPVISFKPNIQFTGTTAYSTGGTAGGAASPGTTPNKGPSECQGTKDQSPELYNEVWKVLRVGHNVAITLLRDERLGRIRKASRYAYNNMYMNNLANLPINAIKAELRVQGDPSYNSPALFLHRFVNITVINPFQIEDEAPCQWKNSIEPCNEILSNGAWVIEGISHDIRNGSYTTTLKVSLPAPGFDLSLFAPNGGGG